MSGSTKGIVKLCSEIAEEFRQKDALQVLVSKVWFGMVWYGKVLLYLSSELYV